MAKKIFLVDDEESITTLMEMRLRSHGFEISAFNDAKKALEKAAEVKPDLVILDISMEPMNGREACRQLKANPVTAKIPVIMFTSNHGATLEQDCIQDGATGIIYKPDVAKLLLLIKDIFAGKKIDWAEWNPGS